MKVGAVAFVRAPIRGLSEWATTWRLFMVGRTLIAVAQLTIYLFTPLAFLTPQVGGVTREQHCAGPLQSWNLICIGLPPDLIRALCVTALLLVISGFVPRWTGLLHLYIALSTATGLTLVDGGESAAVVALWWIAVICLFDHRWNGWNASSPTHFAARASRPWWVGIPHAAAIALKIQCSIIYLHSATAKFGTDAWVDGSAIYYVTRMEMFGVSGQLGSLALAITASPLGSFVITFGTIAIEIAIAVLIWNRGKALILAVALSSALHLAIIALIGIGSFGLIMIGLVFTAAFAADLFAAGRKTAVLRSA